MEVGCELEVDVNGEEIFMVDKKILACFSVRFRRLFAKLTGSSTRHLKVIFQDFPGGADGFELATRFCYNNGAIEITPSNIVQLNCAAYFMEMDRNSSATTNLVEQTEKCLEGVSYWTWSELLIAMKQSQDLFPATNSSCLLEKVLDSLTGRLALPTVASPFICFSDNFSSQFSSEISSTCSTRNNFSPTTWWFEHLLFLNVDLIDKVIKMMVSQRLDHATIFKFLLFYLKSRLLTVVILSDKCQIMEKVISLLFLLDKTCLSCKGLFDILRIISSWKRIKKCYKLKLERLIGSKLDQATLDHLLVRSPRRKDYIYDVDLILRLVKGYLLEGWIIPSRLKRVACLVDSFLIEVAPDILLKSSKFVALLSVLPDSARESSDKLYQAIDLYLEVHNQLCQEEKIRLCCALNHDKLSEEALEHMAQNSKFPSRAEVEVFIAQQPKNISFYSLKTVINGLSFCSIDKAKMTKREDTEKVLSLARKHQHPMESGNCEPRLQEMQWRVTELEKVCTIMESQMPSVTKQRPCNQGKVRSLPKLCSC